jgi:pimeloyl-ACP methyl ester carboxylesterase
MTKRMMRLSAAERDDVRELQEQLRNPAVESAAKNAALARLGQMFTENTDTFNPITFDTEVIEVRYDIHERVWSAAAALRRSGRLLDLGHDIQCPVLAIHGDYDPHPADEIRKPLSDVIKDFRFILLKHCGHYPWLERDARDKFFDVIREEIGR